MDEKELRYNKLLEELYNSQLQLAGISATRFDIVTADTIDEKVETKGHEVAEQAKKYGQPVEMTDGALEQYGKGLESVAEEFASGRNAVLMQNANLNRTEIMNLRDAMSAKKAMEEARANGENYRDKKEMLDGCKTIAVSAAEGSKDCLQNVETIATECNEYLDEIAEDKQLVVQEKQNKISKFFSNIFAKIGGKKKFEDLAVKPLEAKAKDIQENKVPEAKERVKLSLNEKIKATFDKMQEKIREFGEKVSEKIKNVDIKKVVQTLLLAGTGTAMVFGIYSPVNFGLDLTSTVGSWLSEKDITKVKGDGEPLLA